MEAPNYASATAAARRLFGQPGSGVGDTGLLSIGQATLAVELVATLRALCAGGVITAHEVLDAISTIRRQTAIDDETGAPARETLRAMRVLVRDLEFVAPLSIAVPLLPDDEASPDDEALLATCAAAARRLGTARSRGRGRVEMWLSEPERPGLMEGLLARFAAAVEGRVV